MDGFIDKFAQRKNAQEMIRANAMAEAEEKERMASKLSEYELAMQEMRRCNLQTLENSERLKELLMASLNKIEEVQKKDEDQGQKPEELVREIESLSEDLRNRVTELLESQKNQVAELLNEQNAQIQELMETQKKTVEELLHASEDFNHKEAVKVYRNVQAVIESALPKQTEEIKEAVKKEMEGKGTPIGFKIIWVLTFVAAAANVTIEVLKFLGYL